MLLALDIETTCAVEGCSEPQCKHALIPHQSRITIIGIWNGNTGRVFREISDLSEYLNSVPDYTLVGHNIKFDLRHLAFRGLDLSSKPLHDTQVLASCVLAKVPQEEIEHYEKMRKIENEKLPTGYSHREVKGGLSLKILAPYFLGVDPFWEDPTNHDSSEYVLKDCRYTYELFEILSDRATEEGNWNFYTSKMLPLTKLLLGMEMRGVRIDMDLLTKLERDTRLKITDLKTRLDIAWTDARLAFKKIQEEKVASKYAAMAANALAKMKSPTDAKVSKTKAAYEDRHQKALLKLDTEINFDSPAQMLWLLKEFFGFDTEVEVRDKKTGIKVTKDSTGEEVLQRVYAKTKREDIKLFLDYKEQMKLITSFLEPYRSFQHNGVIYCSFNSTGTRTGRLSSSEPNLQQVPSSLHELFIARPGYELACFDESAIEARLLAYYSDCPVLYDLVKNDKDIHGFHTCLFFGLDCDPSEVKEKYKDERQTTKNVGFGLYYGAGAGRIQQEAIKAGYDWSYADCREKAKRFKETYESIYKFKSEIDQMVQHEPMVNLMGRKFQFEDPEDIYMQNLNTLIQGSASDLVCQSAVKIQKEFKEKGIDAQVLLLVHDEIVTEIPLGRREECLEIIKRNMTNYKLETAYGILPLAVEGKVGQSWSK